MGVLSSFALVLVVLGAVRAHATMPPVACQGFLIELAKAADQQIDPSTNDRFARAFARHPTVITAFVAIELSRTAVLGAALNAALDRYEAQLPPKDPVWDGYNQSREIHTRAR